MNVKTTTNKQAVLKKKERLIKTVDVRRQNNRMIDRRVARGLSPVQVQEEEETQTAKVEQNVDFSPEEDEAAKVCPPPPPLASYHLSMFNICFAFKRLQRMNVKTTTNKQAVLKKKECLIKTVDARRQNNRMIDRRVARGLSPIQEKVDTLQDQAVEMEGTPANFAETDDPLTAQDESANHSTLQDQAVEMEGTPGNVSETDDPLTAQDPAANHGSPDDEEDAAAQDFEEEDLNPANFAETDNIVDDEDLIHANLAETYDLTAQDESAEENALDGEEDATAASIVAPEEALRAEALRSAKRCKRDIRWIDYNCVISRRSRRHPNWLRF
jgi:hypothetical protein